ncbi:ABC transporter ATP-binding protein [Microvirga alba]|uniref:ABC transporter ATP-binding protein n=1 Tax=Microvirga alba TaxID=2791025 RepID=A0A931FSJ1_9HYPH|nr:ABC transporter ATP-binding protein [Microvirga alba]MBF9235673.1 ABC transporter ATP-binding protein [Microvirga alba]
MTLAIEGIGLSKIYNSREKMPGISGLWRRKKIAAVADVTIRLEQGKTLAVVGESGSGKSTLGRLLAMMETPDSGSLRFEGRQASELSRAERLALRRRIQMIFQDPYESLDPRLSIRDSVEEPLLALRIDAKEREERVFAALADVELSPPERYLSLRPHQLSGGQRQRVAIARAIVLRPTILIADEPTSMLDVSLRIGILRLLERIRARTGIAILLITHDLALANYASDRVMVMYGGRVVEEGETRVLLKDPKHSYTKLLVASAPRLEPGRQRQRLTRPRPELIMDTT